jgi:hypothetical protein
VSIGEQPQGSATVTQGRRHGVHTCGVTPFRNAAMDLEVDHLKIK